jgi:hypothetical protein
MTNDGQQQTEKQQLREKYADFLTLLDYKNLLVYAALFRQLFADFATENTYGPVNKSLEELASLLERASVKLSCSIHNMTMPQLLKLFKLLMTKLKGSDTLRPHDSAILTPLMYRMYSDAEVDAILVQLEQHVKIEQNPIVGINAKDEIIFQNKMKYPLPCSAKAASAF